MTHSCISYQHITMIFSDCGLQEKQIILMIDIKNTNRKD